MSVEPIDEFGTDVTSAERAVLGAVLETDGACLDELTLTGADFADPRLGEMFDVMVRARLNGAHVTYATLADANPDQAVFISTLVEHGRFKYAVEEHAAIVAKQGLRRRLEAASAGLLDRAADPNLTTDQLVEQAHALLDGAIAADRRPVRFLRDVLPSLLNRIQDHSTFLPTPWPTLDAILGGFRPGAVYVIGGRPAQGKSMIAQQCATALAQHGLVAFSSLEMDEEELTARFVAERVGIGLSRVQDNTMTPGDWERLAMRRRAVENLPVAIDHRTSVTVADIRQHARNVSRRGPLVGVVVDYLQLITGMNPRADRREQIGEASRQLKVMAKDLRVPVIVLSQLNRMSEQRTDPRPRLSELKESGDIEQDADVVMLLYRETSKVVEVNRQKLFIHVAKNRHGEEQEIELRWQGALARAIEIPDEEVQP